MNTPQFSFLLSPPQGEVLCRAAALGVILPVLGACIRGRLILAAAHGVRRAAALAPAIILAPMRPLGFPGGPPPSERDFVVVTALLHGEFEGKEGG